ncbi:hypothetical protein Tco_1144478 [Tanacetum coccineum]
MASLHLESDVGEETPQWIRELRPSSSQLKIPVYPEVRDPRDPWAFKEKMLLEDAIMANVSRAEKKKKCRVGLAILLTDVATRIEITEDEASPPGPKDNEGSSCKSCNLEVSILQMATSYVRGPSHWSKLSTAATMTCVIAARYTQSLQIAARSRFSSSRSKFRRSSSSLCTVSTAAVWTRGFPTEYVFPSAQAALILHPKRPVCLSYKSIRLWCFHLRRIAM